MSGAVCIVCTVEADANLLKRHLPFFKTFTFGLDMQPHYHGNCYILVMLHISATWNCFHLIHLWFPYNGRHGYSQNISVSGCPTDPFEKKVKRLLVIS